MLHVDWLGRLREIACAASMLMECLALSAVYDRQSGDKSFECAYEAQCLVSGKVCRVCVYTCIHVLDLSPWCFEKKNDIPSKRFVQIIFL